MSERITQAEFARRCNVARSTVHKWVQAGRIKLGDDRKLDADEALRMREATESPLPHHQARKAQIEAEKAGETLPAVDEIGRRLKYATMKEREAKSAMAAMEREKLAGRLVDSQQVDFVLQDFGHTLRGLLEGLPDRLAPELAVKRGDVSEIHTLLEESARELLDEINQHMARKAQELSC